MINAIKMFYFPTLAPEAVLSNVGGSDRREWGLQ